MINGLPHYTLIVNSASGTMKHRFHTIKSARHQAKTIAGAPGTQSITLSGTDIKTTVLFDGRDK